MAERTLNKKDLEQTFKGFGKRQSSEFKRLEDRLDSRFKGVDSKFKGLEERVVHQFHVISEGLIDQIKLLVEGHAGIVTRLDSMEKENERQHQETRALVNCLLLRLIDGSLILSRK